MKKVFSKNTNPEDWGIVKVRETDMRATAAICLVLIAGIILFLAVDRSISLALNELITI